MPRHNYPRKQDAPPSGRKIRTRNPAPKARKVIDKKQNRSIMKLQKSVKQLDLKSKGPMLKNYQTMAAQQIVATDRPLMFDLTDFTCQNADLPQDGCRVWQSNGATPPIVAPVSTFSIGQQAANPFWSNQNRDIVSGGSFTPIYGKLTLKFTGRPHLVDTRIRVDLVSYRPSAIRANAPLNPTLIMPNALTHLEDLATPNLNRINRTFFNVIQTKFCYINSAVGDPAVANSVKGTTSNTKYLTFEVRPKKTRYQSRTYPLAGDLVSANNPDVEPANGAFGPTNCPIDAPLWCIISSNAPSTQGADRVLVNISRTCVWRNPGPGGASL